jgi:formylglycine-generating enzyme required for sulfatase activity
MESMNRMDAEAGVAPSARAPRRRHALLGAVSTALLLAPALPSGETSGTLAQVAFRDRFLDGSGRTGPELIAVPEGSFIMGSRPEEPGYRPTETQHEVTTSAYAIGRFEVTNAEFAEFLNERGNQLDDGIRWILLERSDRCLIREIAPGRFAPAEGAADRPVVTISWNAANAYCAWLSEKTGRLYRLPTEAEWERAARAGTSTIWPWGDAFDPARLAWEGNSAAASRPVGSFPANPWGIHDMLGNTWEWVLDCFQDDFYAVSPSRDPLLLDEDCWVPGIRGGSFRDGPEWCRPGYRINTWWWGEYDSIGFRVARLDAPPKPRRPARPSAPKPNAP